MSDVYTVIVEGFILECDKTGWLTSDSLTMISELKEDYLFEVMFIDTDFISETVNKDSLKSSLRPDIDVTARFKHKPIKLNKCEKVKLSSTYGEFPKQDRYKDANGEDWIDECARTFTQEEFTGAMKFTIGRYTRRVGKKDDPIKEIEKIADYGQRWLQYLRNLQK